MQFRRLIKEKPFNQIRKNLIISPGAKFFIHLNVLYVLCFILNFKSVAHEKKYNLSLLNFNE